jgi:hypothetical protein
MECRGQIMVLSVFLNSVIQDGESCDLALIPTIVFREQYCGSLHAAQWHQHTGWQLPSADPAHGVPAWFALNSHLWQMCLEFR